MIEGPVMTGNSGNKHRHGRAKAQYRTFILRCWQEPVDASDRDPVWRFSLITIEKRNKLKGFTDLDSVMSYIKQLLTKDKSNNSEGKRP